MKHLLKQPHIIFSPENPRYDQSVTPASIDEVHQYLIDQGEDAHKAHGKYGDHENSIIIMRPKNPQGILNMAKDLGQESVLLSNQGNHELRYVNGPNEGKSHYGKGTQFHINTPDDFYTKLDHPQGKAIFTHNIDFSDLHDSSNKIKKSEQLAKNSALPDSAFQTQDAFNAALRYRSPREMKDIAEDTRATPQLIAHGIEFLKKDGGYNPDSMHILKRSRAVQFKDLENLDQFDDTTKEYIKNHPLMSAYVSAKHGLNVNNVLDDIINIYGDPSDNNFPIEIYEKAMEAPEYPGSHPDSREWAMNNTFRYEPGFERKERMKNALLKQLPNFNEGQIAWAANAAGPSLNSQEWDNLLEHHRKSTNSPMYIKEIAEALDRSKGGTEDHFRNLYNTYGSYHAKELLGRSKFPLKELVNNPDLHPDQADAITYSLTHSAIRDADGQATRKKDALKALITHPNAEVRKKVINHIGNMPNDVKDYAIAANVPGLGAHAPYHLNDKQKMQYLSQASTPEQYKDRVHLFRQIHPTDLHKIPLELLHRYRDNTQDLPGAQESIARTMFENDHHVPEMIRNWQTLDPNMQEFDRYLQSADRDTTSRGPYMDNFTPEHVQYAINHYGTHPEATNPYIQRNLNDWRTAKNATENDVRAAYAEGHSLPSILKHPKVPLDILHEHAHTALGEEALKAHGQWQDPEVVHVAHNTNKLRHIRDLAEESGGAISKRELEKRGFNVAHLGISQLLDGKGNLSAKKVQQHIDALPKVKYGISHDTYGDGLDPEDVNDETYWDRALKDVNPHEYLDEDEAWEDFQNKNPFVPEEHVNKDDFISHDEDGDEEYFDEDAYNAAVNEAEEDWNQGLVDGFDLDDYINSPHFDKEKFKQDHIQNLQQENIGGQQHNHLKSKVLQVNFTPEHAQKLKEAGLWDSFKSLLEDSKRSGHPVTGNTLGWVRYTETPKTKTTDGQVEMNTEPSDIHIDEIQSDFAQNLYRVAQKQAEDAKKQGYDPEKVDAALQEVENKYHPEKMKAINDILFDGKHANDAIHEAFHQYMRDQGRAGDTVSIWQAQPKSEISGMSSTRELPGHMKRTYDQKPPEMGYKAAKYGDIPSQDNSSLRGSPTWNTKLRKKEITLDDIAKILEKELEEEIVELEIPHHHVTAAQSPRMK